MAHPAILIADAIAGLTPEAKRLLNFFAKGKRFANREETTEEAMIPRSLGTESSHQGIGGNYYTRFPNNYYTGYPTDVTYEDLERIKRAAASGYTLPAWRGVKSFPPGRFEDPSFSSSIGRGAHVDLSPSAHASKIWLAKYGTPFTGEEVERNTGLLPGFPAWNTRLMTQMAIKPPKHPVLVTDVEANEPEMLARIFQQDPDKLFSGAKPTVFGDDPTPSYWDRIKGFAQEADIDLLYPNTGEVFRKIKSPFRRASMADKAETFINYPDRAGLSFEDFMKNRSLHNLHNANLSGPNMSLARRIKAAERALEDPEFMSLLGNPSYVVMDPTRMRDLALGSFRNPEGRSIFDAKGGYVRKGGLSHLK